MASSRNQKTLAAPAKLKGLGLHSGAEVKLVCKPAPENSGITLQRVDLPGSKLFAATVDNLKADSLQRQTTLISEDGAEVATVEHLLSACSGLGITNLHVEINAPECPMLDGSAQPFVDAFTKAGFTKQSAPVQTASFAEPITYVEDHAEISYVPSDDFRVTFFADFGDSIVGNQVYHYVAETTDYAAEIAPARTFVFKKEIEALKKANLIKGGSLENALVITAQGYMNGPLRFSTEIVRHKLLDLLGDLMLLGKPLRGHVLANKSGHRSHVAFVQQLRERMSP